MAQSEPWRSQERKRGWRTTSTRAFGKQHKSPEKHSAEWKSYFCKPCSAVQTHFQRQDSITSTIHQQLLPNLGPSAEEFELGSWFLSCSLIYLPRPLMADAWPSILLQAPHCALQAGFQRQSKGEQSCSLSAELLRAGLRAHPTDELLVCWDMLEARPLQGVKWLICFHFWVKPWCNAGLDPQDTLTNNKKRVSCWSHSSQGSRVLLSSQSTYLDFIGGAGLEVVNPSSQGFSGQEGLCCDTSIYSSPKLLQAPVFTHHKTLKLHGLFPSGPQGPSWNSPAFLKPLEQKILISGSSSGSVLNARIRVTLHGATRDKQTNGNVKYSVFPFQQNLANFTL